MSSPNSNPVRLPLIDAFKAIASQSIVLHHLSFYGPMSDVAFPLAPGFFTWLSRYGQLAVSIFLVTAGFLAAKHLAPVRGFLPAAPWKTILRRYLRLMIPYLVALTAAMLCAAFARIFIEHDTVPPAPNLKQVLAHIFLLQDILGMDALSAGVWYIAIDFQLFAVMALILWLSFKLTRFFSPARDAGHLLAFLCMTALGLASLFFFNRDANWDNLFIYFAATYMIGAAAYWISASGNIRQAIFSLGILALTVILALCLHYRARLVVALCVGLMLGITPHLQIQKIRFDGLLSRLVTWLGKISYSVFLVHFPVFLVISALFFHWAPDNAWINLAGIFITWACSLICGAWLHQRVEKKM